MKERLLKFLSRQQLTSKQFADLIGVQPSSVSHILSGRNKPSFDFMEKIALYYPSISLEWLITGNGSMFRETKQPSGSNEKNLFSHREESPPLNKEDENTTEVTNVNKGTAGTDYKSNMKAETANDDSGDPDALSVKGKKVKMIIVMYSDRTFSEYFPAV